MTFDDHWADTQKRMQIWASQLGFIDEEDTPEGFRFVLDGNDEMCAFHIGQLIADLKPPTDKQATFSNLLVYFVAVLKGQLVIDLPRMGLHVAMIQAGHLQQDLRDSRHYDKEHLFAKYQDNIEDLIVEHFRTQLTKCRRAQIKEVK